MRRASDDTAGSERERARRVGLGWHSRLATRLAASVFLLSSVVVAFAVLGVYDQARDELQASVFDRLTDVAASRSERFETWIGVHGRLLDVLAGGPDFRSGAATVLSSPPGEPATVETGDALLVFFGDVLRSWPGVGEVALLAADGGRVALSTDPSHTGTYRPVDTYFTEGLHAPFSSKVYLSGVTGDPVVTLARPLADEQGATVGVLVVHLDFESLIPLLENPDGLGDTGHVWVVDDSRTIVPTNSPDERRGVESFAIDRAIRGASGTAAYRGHTGAEVLGAYMPIPETGVALVVEMDQSEAFGPARQLAVVALLFGLTSMALLVVGALWVSRRVTRPVVDVALAALAVADGDLERTTSVRRGDELGVLSRTFNRMTGQLRSLYATLQEKVVALSAAEEDARSSSSRLRLALEAGRMGTWELDLSTGCVAVSPQVPVLFGREPGAAVRDIDQYLGLMSPSDRGPVAAAIAAAVQGEEDLRIEHPVHWPDGSEHWLAATARVVPNGGGSKLTGVVIDVTERHRYEDELAHRALHDSLTGLANRALYLDRVGQALGRRRRSPQSPGFAVVFMDLDRFKVVNDSLGHVAGDTLLVGIANRLREAVRPVDTVARLGGDEFGLLVEGAEDTEHVVHLIKRLMVDLAEPFDVGGREIAVTVSCGIVVSDGSDDTPGELLRNADTAMYRAKATGGDTYAVFDIEMHHQAVERLLVEAELRRALAASELVVHYQPIVALPDRDTVGFEALVRWQHPTRGLLPPGAFIPAAEQSGLIVEIGTWVLDEACREVRSWRDRGAVADTAWVSVNLSPRQFHRGDLVSDVDAALARHELAPDALRLEVTESCVMEDVDIVLEVLRSLRLRGLKVCIDDFGTGFSSLSLLHRAPFDVLKVDRSFVADVDREEASIEIVRTVTTLGETLGLEVVAEGVERSGQVRVLEGLGCGFAQGFLFGRPAPAPGRADRLPGLHSGTTA
ncbi:MAG: EAL domain-containing protein [Acidimicrobiia bacterium]|nr:EAL domain-containing protein [Acidimicrobiia bacterium]